MACAGRRADRCAPEARVHGRPGWHLCRDELRAYRRTYFDLLDTSHTLTPIDARSTRVRLDIRYRVSTRFNWYADPVAGS